MGGILQTIFSNSFFVKIISILKKNLLKHDYKGLTTNNCASFGLLPSGHEPESGPILIMLHEAIWRQLPYIVFDKRLSTKNGLAVVPHIQDIAMIL